MKVTLNWLKQYVDFDWSPEALAGRLTMLGLEVEGVRKVAGEFEGIVVAQILTKDKVPGSDKLTVCKVNDGTVERTIICGAQNHNVGDKVALILPNYALPLKQGEKEPFVIKERKVFGITSRGMMCSPQELGLPDQVDGLLILREDAKIGQPFAEYLGRTSGDVVYDLEVTPNRPDLNSVIGIAREIAASSGNALKMPEVTVATGPMSLVGEEPGTDVDSYVAVRVEEPELCPRYVARVITGVKIGPSPDWLRAMLEKVGVRSINNVVDVTNYVMLETGQPLHAFDCHLVAKGADGKPTVVIRRAKQDEKFTTLDGVERTLTNEMLLIADEQNGIALAGVMGGQNTEINERTKDVLIESAYFKPSNIRRTSKALGLRSESSYRFERGADIGITDWASRRCAQLILEAAGGQLVSGAVDALSGFIESRQITLRHQKVNDLLGIELKPHEIEHYLCQLGLRTANRKPRPVGEDAGPPDPVMFQIPTFRVDLKRETDLVEEVARLYGAERIPATPPRGAIGSNAFDAVYDQIAEARRILTGLGLNEAQGQTLVSKSEVRSAKDEELVALANPLSSDMDVLRPSLIPGLLASLRHNLHHETEDVALFEIGRVFTRPNGRPKEDLRLALAMTGRRFPNFWSGVGSAMSSDEVKSLKGIMDLGSYDERRVKFDACDLKGIIEVFLDQFGLRGVSYSRCEKSIPWSAEPATISLGGKLPLGEMGRLSPLLRRKFDLSDDAFLAELNLDQLLARRNPNKSFKPLPQFPSVRRDIAMLVPESTTHDAVLNAVRQARPANLESVELFDVFRGQNVPEGQKSMAYAFTYRHAERTLTDDEVNTAHEKLVEQFKAKLQATVR